MLRAQRLGGPFVKAGELDLRERVVGAMRVRTDHVGQRWRSVAGCQYLFCCTPAEVNVGEGHGEQHAQNTDVNCVSCKKPQDKRCQKPARSCMRPTHATFNTPLPLVPGARAQTLSHTRTHTDAHTHARTDTRRHTDKHKHMQTQPKIHRRTDPRIYKHTDTQKRSHTQTHRHAETWTWPSVRARGGAHLSKSARRI